MVQSAVGKISSLSAGHSPAETVLRGTIYDRKFNELAVSYRLYSVSVQPGEVINLQKTAEALAPFIGRKAEVIQQRLRDWSGTVELADDLDDEQAAQIEALGIKGVSCKATEVRFYPGHTAASHVLGFMGDGVGLAGVEGKYDAVLQAGPFRSNNIPDIDFKGQASLGAGAADLILSLDLDLQRQLESRFRQYLASHDAAKGMGLLIEPGSGRILALVNQPSFNPNYFWKAKETSRVNRMYNHVLDKSLIRPILARAAAIEREGLSGSGLLPETVAASDYGFTSDKLAAFEEQIQLYGSVFGNWESGPVTDQSVQEPVVTGVQVGVTIASLVNGGWRITPYVIDSVYDHATAKRYFRSNEATRKEHVLDPALGVKIRRELFANWQVEEMNLVSYSAAGLQLGREKGYSRYSMQELFAGMIPAKQPKFLLLMAIERDYLQPLTPESKKEKGTLEQMGRELLASFQVERQERVAEAPPPKSAENLRQFFISRRLNVREEPGKASEQVALMPRLRGMSLRKGLQQLNPHAMKIQVSGSGRIIAQYPLPGTPLRGVNECILTLDAR
jgi:cell division protein FtsI (penicillin-binding protein 3)